MGKRLHRFARGDDSRSVSSRGVRKSISAETTLESNAGDLAVLVPPLDRLCARVAERLERSQLAALGVTLKLKTGDFHTITRSATLSAPTQRAHVLFESALRLLEREANGTAYRLIGVGASRLADAGEADPPELLGTPD
jgi:DNA polymerase-4